MSIDGISMNQVKPARELPSNHLSFEADEVAAMKNPDQITGIEGASKEKGIGRKEDNYGEDVENQMAGGSTEAGDENAKVEEAPDFSELLDNDKKRYCLKFNRKSAMVQLYDKKTKKVIRSIDEENLLRVMAKIKYPAGIIHAEEV